MYVLSKRGIKTSQSLVQVLHISFFFFFLQNLVQATPPLPPMLSRPLPPAQHVQYLKHQGNLFVLNQKSFGPNQSVMQV